MAKRVAYVVAPYSPIGRSPMVHLGAAKKLAAVIEVLASLDYRVRLINSAHNVTVLARGRAGRLRINGVRLVELTPFTLPWRPLGKLLNLFAAYRWGRVLSRRRPQALVWIYNGYAFESVFALRFGTRCSLAVELEDLPFSRRNRFHLKDRLDSTLLSRALSRARLVTAVNETMVRKLSLPARCPVVLFPSTLGDQSAGAEFKVPFSGQPYRVGYFGGLSVEKGADVMLSLAAVLPADWAMYVTGNGPLASAFADLSRRLPGVLFRENASDSEVLALMSQCDVLVNPHKLIAAMHDGIFPFKVYEYLSTGRLVLSTPLPPSAIDLGKTVVWFNGEADELCRQLATAAHVYRERRCAIAATAAEVRARYSRESIAEVIQRALPSESPAQALQEH